MPSLEQEIKTYFTANGIPFHDHSFDEQRFQRLDFGFGDRSEKRYFSFDAKEKRRRYNLSNWPDVGIPEQALFIIDDLAARKILMFAPNSGLIIRDNTTRRYYLFTVVDLYLMPKVRVNRPIQQRQQALKGKWLIDLRNGRRFSTLAEVFEAIDAYLDQREAIFGKELACFGEYVGEDIAQGGITRRPEHWQTDVKATR